MTLADFILARVADDEVAWGPEVNDLVMGGIAVRMLAECEAKRRIVGLHVCACPDPTCGDCGECSGLHHADPTPAPCDTLRLLALPYADHEDYDEGWRP